MLRILLELAVPLLLPSAVYVAWLFYEQRRAARLGRSGALNWREVPVLWLTVAGVALAGAFLIGSALMRPNDTTGRYVPPQVIDGQVVPGHVEPAPAPRR